MWKYLFLFLGIQGVTLAQPISGYYADIVRDQNGSPIAGASVRIKSTRLGTTTDKNGYFKIEVTVGNILSISSVGYAGGDIKVTAAMLQAHAAVDQKPVEPVLSDDYAALICRDSGTMEKTLLDLTPNIRNKTWQLTGGLNTYLPVTEISIHHQQLQIHQRIRKQLTFSGSYHATVEIKNVNRTPALQTQFVQGRPQNGALSWRGPETGEPFSFGPPVQSLEYDGSMYQYDRNGRLVTTGSGNSSKVNVYDNSIFQTAFLHSQSFQLSSSFIANNERILTLIIEAGNTHQSTTIRQNTNSAKNIAASVSASLKKFTITGNYAHVQDRFSNSNRNGFLNRVYQNAILTPVSFDNGQGYLVANGQRSYRSGADNPYFLLSENGNSFLRSQSNAGLALEKKQKHFSFKLVQSLEWVKQVSNEVYKPGTAYFENGIHIQRVQADKTYSLHATTVYKIPFANYHFRSAVSANYNFSAAHTLIRYSEPGTNYRYQRSAHQASISNNGSYSNRNFEAGFDAATKFYLSNTSTQKKFFLPAVGAYVRFANVLRAFNIKISSSFNSFNSELPVNHSLAYTNLLQYSTQQSFQYFPVQEVSGYDGLTPIHHKEWAGRVEVSYKNKFSLYAEAFNRHNSNDIFPVYQNGKLELRNIADHQNKGIELQLSFNDYYRYHKKIVTQHSLSFFSYRSLITKIKDGYNYLPIAGFSNVHKAIVKGEPLGVIIGNAYLQDANKNIIIGTDGFPLVDNTAQVIGNPVPDFIMKLTNNIQWKKLTLHMDWEWKRGGDVWNGTQATLDYYGRSQNSALLRNTENYIFSGILQNGQKNGIPVNFSNWNEPVENNRWTRYGYSGVAAEYIQKADYIRINSLSLAYRLPFKKYIQAVTLSAYINNILLWSAYAGADPSRLLYDEPATEGLDFFNLPSDKTFGVNASIQF